MARPNVSSNKAFRKQANIRRGAGPIHNKFINQPFNKRKDKQAGRVGCDGVIDNNVTYVYNILPDGNHLAYVDCDYVV
ncbi:MAG: hypothetical protein GTO02_15120 [Candidatus Dadabacteria bacterium]|nr:hypothetical protein [Candidatus Dadabacteria bacterium]